MKNSGRAGNSRGSGDAPRRIRAVRREVARHTDPKEPTQTCNVRVVPKNPREDKR